MVTAPVVLKENHLQLVTDTLGDIPSGNAEGLGLYYQDTRYLSTYELLVNGQHPLYLSHSAERDYIATFQYVNPELRLPDGTTVPRQSISIRRSRFVDAHTLRDRLGFYNCNRFAIDLELRLNFDADFRDMFAVRGFVPQRMADGATSRFSSDGLTFSYVGRDGVPRHTVIQRSETPEPLSPDSMFFRVHLPPHVPISIVIGIRPFVGHRGPAHLLDFDGALDRLIRSYERWHEESTEIATDNVFFDRSLLRQSRYDLRALLEVDEMPAGEQNGKEATHTHVATVPSAGIPWYAVPFGRDSIITALQTLMYNPAIAEGTLRFLAYHQGRETRSETEEEPGKIMHELRRGELANLREIPHIPYYGTVDATPLFVVLFVETMAWLESEELYHDLLPHVRRALEWIDAYGDMDGDGYVEYRVQRKQGVVLNQGWKDSEDSLLYEDGAEVRQPAALVEVQGYVYQAKLGLSRLVAARGDTELAERLRREAEELRARFNRDFWMADEGFFAQALDANKKMVRAVTSNVGHCLWSEIIDRDKAEPVVRRLLAPDMFSGWGIRTLSNSSKNYNPMSYHNGSVWPHDNSIIAEGMRRYGFTADAIAVIDAMVDAGLRFPSNRLPEVFCGFPRDTRFNSSPVAYIKSCSPQAWAAAAPFLFLQTLLGARPLDGGNELELDPVTTKLFGYYRFDRVRVGHGRAGFEVRSAPDHVEVTRLGGTIPVRLASERNRADAGYAPSLPS